MRENFEERTLKFSKDVIKFCRKLPLNVVNRRLIDQIIRSACSVGANYREANESLSKKDAVFRLRIARKEAKETYYWFNLIEEANQGIEEEIKVLLQETKELRNILSAMIEKSR